MASYKSAFRAIRLTIVHFYRWPALWDARSIVWQENKTICDRRKHNDQLFVYKIDSQWLCGSLYQEIKLVLFFFFNRKLHTCTESDRKSGFQLLFTNGLPHTLIIVNIRNCMTCARFPFISLKFTVGWSLLYCHHVWLIFRHLTHKRVSFYSQGRQ